MVSGHEGSFLGSTVWPEPGSGRALQSLTCKIITTGFERVSCPSYL